MREWKRYHNKNKTEGDCQLVSAVNAYYHLTGEYISQDSERYEKFIDLSKCRNGAAISIKKVWDELGIEQYGKRYGLFEEDLPIEVSVWYKRCGLHSALITDRIERCRAIQVTNLKWLTTYEGWIFEEDFRHYVSDNMGYPIDERNLRFLNRCWSFRLK